MSMGPLSYILCWLEPLSPRESVQTTQENICWLIITTLEMGSSRKDIECSQEPLSCLRGALFACERVRYPDEKGTPLSYTCPRLPGPGELPTSFPVTLSPLFPVPLSKDCILSPS